MARNSRILDGYNTYIVEVAVGGIRGAVIRDVRAVWGVLQDDCGFCI